MRTALITGVNGQDGSYLADFLLSKGYRIVGTVSSHDFPEQHLCHLTGKIEIAELNLLNQAAVQHILSKTNPDEVFNLAARASSKDLWTDPVLTGETNGLAVARILDAIKQIDSRIRFVQASSSEVFGNATEVPQTETTPFHPRNPYGLAKAYGHWAVGMYREHQGLFACSCILYNHESPRRGLEFVSRKITNAAARISLGEARELRLGRLDSRRDWGFAGDYVQAMWLMLQNPRPDDYIIATGESHSVREFCEIAFSHLGLNYERYVVEDPANMRPAEPTSLVGTPAKAQTVIGWKPTVAFADLVRMMVDAELKMLRTGTPANSSTAWQSL